MSIQNDRQGFGSWLREFFRYDFWTIILDIAAVNVSYLLALYIRFFVNGTFRASVGYYLDYFAGFAPFYTVLALLIFLVFRLYGGMWRFAGLNDLNRIIMANIVTSLLQIGGSMLYLALLPGSQANRMPFTYYVIGGGLQFVFVVMIRFAHKILLAEKAKIASSKVEAIPVLVVGSNELGRRVMRHLEENTVFRPVAIVGKDSGRAMDGIPIVSLDGMEKLIADKKVRAVFIADKDLTKEQRDRIRQAAEGLEMTDFTGYMSNQTGFLPLTNLLDVMEMPIHVEVDGKEMVFSSAKDCLSALPGEYDIEKVQATRLVLKKRGEDTGWMQEYREQTGEEVSFF